MPLPASVIAGIVSAILETATQDSAPTTQKYNTYVVSRTLPPEARLGVMEPPGYGQVAIDGKVLRLSPAAQFRSLENLIVMPMTIQEKKDVVYLTDASGAVFRVWLISKAEVSAFPKN